jgi:hypothetical protein
MTSSERRENPSIPGGPSILIRLDNKKLSLDWSSSEKSITADGTAKGEHSFRFTAGSGILEITTCFTDGLLQEFESSSIADNPRSSMTSIDTSWQSRLHRLNPVFNLAIFCSNGANDEINKGRELIKILVHKSVLETTIELKCLNKGTSN